MTALEKQIFENAKKKHKETMTKPQVVHGKTFKGDSFISKPAQIKFTVNSTNPHVWIKKIGFFCRSPDGANNIPYECFAFFQFF